MTATPHLSTRTLLVSFRRLGIGALGVAAVAAGVSLQWMSDAPAPMAAPTIDGKLMDRLAFGADDEIPVRDTRVFDTIAMFSAPTAEPTAWSTGTLSATSTKPVTVASAIPTLAEPASHTATAALPRMVGAPAHRMAALPPSRPAPAVLASAAPTSRVAPAVPTEARRPIELAGWEVPGSQHLPTGRDVQKVASAVGSGAVAIGGGAIDLVADGASTVGGAVTRVGNGVASTIGWR